MENSLNQMRHEIAIFVIRLSKMKQFSGTQFLFSREIALQLVQ